MLRVAFLLSSASVLLGLSLAACASDSSSSTGTADASPGNAPGGDASGDAANEAAGDDECTSKGPLYECHAYDLCNANYMPVTGVSCGARGGYCCVKGALPPVDASADASTDG